MVGEELINAARRDRARYDAVHKFGPVAPLRALFERIEAAQAEYSNFPDEQRQRRWRVLERLLSGRSAFVLGSSHQDDDTAIAEALFPIQSSEGDLLLVVAPRDILESQMVARALSARGYRAGLLGEMDGTERLDILVIDVLGFLMPLYARAVGAFVGGGLHGVRDHNFVEPLLFGAPTWTGPHHFWSPERWDLLQSLAPNLVGELTHDQLHRLPGLLQATDNTPAARRHRAGRLKHFLEASEKLALEGTRELSQDLLTLLRELRADPGQIETCDRREELVYLNLVKHVTVPNVLNVETDWAPHWRLANHVPYLLDLLDRTQPR
ncbi:MAG: hypothetical protein KC492_33145 [Myxococcales bacterium]|nr:hypothetical protein [Myxococcales bacterium]